MRIDILKAMKRRDINFLLDFNYSTLSKDEVEYVHMNIHKLLEREIEFANLAENIELNLKLFDEKRDLPEKGCYKFE